MGGCVVLEKWYVADFGCSKCFGVRRVRAGLLRSLWFRKCGFGDWRCFGFVISADYRMVWSFG